MTDLEMVIKGLECCSHEEIGDCDNCPYNKIVPHCDVEMMHDAISLLKAQQPRQIINDEWDQWRHTPDGKRDPLYLQIGETSGWWILAPAGWMEYHS